VSPLVLFAAVQNEAHTKELWYCNHSIWCGMNTTGYPKTLNKCGITITSVA